TILLTTQTPAFSESVGFGSTQAELGGGAEAELLNERHCVSMLRIRGGKVYDPANNVSGEVRDVCIAGGKVVADVDAAARTLDATGMVVFPGGVDVHTHVAGAALNFARGLIPEQHHKAVPIFHGP